MKLGLLELRRRPGRFASAIASLTLLVVLLLLLGGLLDGLYLGSTGAIRAQQGDVIVYSAESRDSFLRSRITPELRAEVEAVDGVAATGGLGVALLGATVPGEEELADVSLFGYELPPAGVPATPPAGQGIADRALEAAGVAVGDVLEVGPGAVPVEVVGWTEDTSYLLQGALWVAPETWRAAQSAARPDDAVGEGVFQVLVVDAEPGVDPAVLAERIDEATGGATSTLTQDEAVLSLPGTKEQNSTFAQLINTTLFVAALVSGLFFALLVVERLPLYATLKAVGAHSRQLLGGVVAQAVLVALVAIAIGGVLTVVLSLGIPPSVPIRLEPGRAVTTATLLVAASALGAAVSLRRITKIDPATAIG